MIASISSISSASVTPLSLPGPGGGAAVRCCRWGRDSPNLLAAPKSDGHAGGGEGGDERHRCGQREADFHHPDVGDLDLDYDALEIPAVPGLTIATYTLAATAPHAPAFARFQEHAEHQCVGRPADASLSSAHASLTHTPENAAAPEPAEADSGAA
ncbi:hypothetical protein [Streptomyces incarnatus]|uniref:MmyB family transcriptional regulator n=1 Tax=Streptomyces incarnatus TaxID=665007 RepID=UPI000ACAF312|nr:hypothetical protein [Streptomyces incarnatus]